VGSRTKNWRQYKITSFFSHETSSREQAQLQTHRLRFATSADPKGSSRKTCGTCAYLKQPILLSQRFVETCRSLFSANKNTVSIEVLAMLVKEAMELNNSKMKCNCRKTGTPGSYGWTHLLDTACYAWEPREEPKT
jgi:hypothetical protein